MKLSHFDLPGQAYGIFWLTFFPSTEMQLCGECSVRDQRHPAYIPPQKPHPASQESILFGSWGSKQLSPPVWASLCIYFTQVLTGHTYAVEKGSKVLDSPHATPVPVHSHLP